MKIVHKFIINHRRIMEKTLYLLRTDILDRKMKPHSKPTCTRGWGKYAMWC